MKKTIRISLTIFFLLFSALALKVIYVNLKVATNFDQQYSIIQKMNADYKSSENIFKDNISEDILLILKSEDKEILKDKLKSTLLVTTAKKEIFDLKVGNYILKGKIEGNIPKLKNKNTGLIVELKDLNFENKQIDLTYEFKSSSNIIKQDDLKELNNLRVNNIELRKKASVPSGPFIFVTLFLITLIVLTLPSTDSDIKGDSVVILIIFIILNVTLIISSGISNWSEPPIFTTIKDEGIIERFYFESDLKIKEKIKEETTLYGYNFSSEEVIEEGEYLKIKDEIVEVGPLDIKASLYIDDTFPSLYELKDNSEKFMQLKLKEVEINKENSTLKIFYTTKGDN